MSRNTAPMPAATDVTAQESQLADLAAQVGLTPEQIQDIRTRLSQISPEEEPEQEDSRLGLGQDLDIGTLIASLSGGGKQDLSDGLKAKLVEMIAGQLGLDPKRTTVLAELLSTVLGGKQRRRRTTPSVSKATGTGGTTSKSKATGTGGTTSKSKATGTGGTTSKTRATGTGGTTSKSKATDTGSTTSKSKTTGTGSTTSKSKAKRTGGTTRKSPKSSATRNESEGAEESRSEKAR